MLNGKDKLVPIDRELGMEFITMKPMDGGFLKMN